jgi:hypothetical protein
MIVSYRSLSDFRSNIAFTCITIGSVTCKRSQRNNASHLVCVISFVFLLLRLEPATVRTCFALGRGSFISLMPEFMRRID